MQFSKEVKDTLWNLIDEMALDLSDFTVNPGKDFSRKKKWDFPTLVKFIISMEGQSLKNELHKYFEYTIDCPTNVSFNQRRAQIRPDAFEHLYTTFTAQCNSDPSLYNGFKYGDSKGFNQLHLNAMYDLLDRIYTDIVIQPVKIENEHNAFCDMVDRYTRTEKTIFIG